MTADEMVRTIAEKHIPPMQWYDNGAIVDVPRDRDYVYLHCCAALREMYSLARAETAKEVIEECARDAEIEAARRRADKRSADAAVYALLNFAGYLRHDKNGALASRYAETPTEPKS